MELKNSTPIEVIKVNNDVDMYTSPEFRKKIVNSVSKAKTKLIIDLSGVTYIDSSGIAILIDGLKRCIEKKISFFLAQPSKAVLDMLELALLEDVFNIKDTLEEALNG